MAKKNQRRKNKKSKTKYQRPAPQLSDPKHLPSWSTTLSCIGGAVGCFHPVCGVVMMAGVWLVACWERNSR